MTENLKNMTDDEVINIINKIVTDNEDLELSDLKMILAEASGRKLEKKYINIIAERIKAKIQPEPVELKRKPEPVEKIKAEKKAESTKPTFDDVYDIPEDEEDEDYEKYPVLSFLAGLYKVFAWILLVGIIAVAGIASLLMFKNNIVTVCALMFGSIILGIFALILFYSMSEKIRIKMDIEQHLRKLLEK